MEKIKIPSLLKLIFLFEAFEKFSCYALRSILTIYMISDISEGGCGFSNLQALRIYGNYKSACLFFAVIMGFLSDFIGSHRSLFTGSIFLTIGYYFLTKFQYNFLYVGLCIICMSSGLIKTSVTKIINNSCNELEIIEKEKIEKKLIDKDCNIRQKIFYSFYVFIHAGSLAGSFSSGYIQKLLGWKMVIKFIFTSVLLGTIFLIFSYFKAEKNETKKINNDKVSTLNKKDFLMIVILLTANFFYAMVHAFDGGLLTVWLYKFTAYKSNKIMIITCLQSLHPLLVIIGVPVICKFFNYARKNNLMNCCLHQLAISIIFSIMACFPFIYMQYESINYNSVGLIGPILYYLFITIGEVSQIPLVLSTLLVLAPAKYVGRVLGINLFITAMGIQVAKLISVKTIQLMNLNFAAGVTLSIGIAVVIICLTFAKSLEPCLKNKINTRNN